jgi:hypothetical protein
MDEGRATRPFSQVVLVVLQWLALASPLALAPLAPKGLLPRGFAFLLVNGY